MRQRPFHPSDIGGEVDGSPSSDIVEIARELERLDSGVLRPSEGFTDRVLAAIAVEPLPRPMAVAGVAAREGRVRAMLGALRDTWHVAWSGGRPLVARAQAMAFVILLVVAVGSVGALGTARGDQRPLLDEQLAVPHAAHEGAGRDTFAPAGRADPDRQADGARRTHRDGRTHRNGQADRDSGSDRDTGSDRDGRSRPHPETGAHRRAQAHRRPGAHGRARGRKRSRRIGDAAPLTPDRPGPGVGWRLATEPGTLVG